MNSTLLNIRDIRLKIISFKYAEAHIEQQKLIHLFIYIYKEESLSVCLFVCLFAMHSHTVRPNATKLSTDDLYIHGKVDVYFVREKNEPYRCCRQSVKLTNRIAAFLGIGDLPHRTPRSLRRQVAIGFRGR